MRRPLISTALFVCATALAACSQEAERRDAGRPSAAPPIAAADLAGHIATLASDAFEGRAPSTPGGRKTRDYLAAEMARIGFAPGAGDDFFQPVPLVSITLAAGSRFAIGPAGAQTPLAAGEEIVYWTTREQEEVAFADSELVFVGYGAAAPEYGWNDYAGADVRGKTVVMLVNDPGYATQDPELFNGNAMTYYGRWTYKFEEAARQGATAAIVIHETAPASYGWDVVAGSWQGAQYHPQRADGGASRVAAEAWITEAVARRLFSEAGLDFEAMKEAAKTPGFTAVDMGGLTASARLRNQIARQESANVVGVLPGSARPDEYVLYMAHWDHLGRNDDLPGADKIYNGAVDNATGTAAILAIGEAFAKAETPPERSIMLVAVTAEESGLLGSAYFGENPVAPLANIVGGINLDAMLPLGRTRDLIVIGYGASELEDVLREKAEAAGKYLRPDEKPEAGYFYRSDHISLAKKGVPMLYLDTGVDAVEGGEAAGRAFADAYTAERYHKPADEYDVSWDLTGVAEDVTLAYRVGAALANSDAWPNWYEGNEFRALRDAQRAE